MSARNYYHDADLYPDPETHDNGEYAYEPRALLATQTRGGDPIALPAWLAQPEAEYLWDDAADDDAPGWDALTGYAAEELGGTVVAVRPVAIGRARSLAGWLAVALLAVIGAALMSVPGELGPADDVMFWMVLGAVLLFAALPVVRRVARRG